MGAFLKKYRYLLIFGLLLVSTVSQNDAQNSEEPNPFDLLYRMDKAEQLAIIAPEENPFDISAPAKSLEKELKEKEIYNEDILFQLLRYEGDQPVPKSWLLFLILPLLLMLTFVASLFRDKLILLHKSFTNSNMLNLAYRESVGRTNIHSLFLYILSIISFGIFGFILFVNSNINTENFFQAVSACLFLSTVYVIAKYLCIFFVRTVFSHKKTMGLYLFMFGQYNHLLAISIIPFSVFLAFAPSSATTIISYISLVFIAFWWIIRLIRGLQIGSKFISMNIFRFFAYFCTVEITPILILLTTLRFILDF